MTFITRVMTLAALTAGLASPADAGVRRFAVVIGVNDGILNDEPLVYAERDAERVAMVLEELGSVPAADIVLLRNSRADRVRAALQSLAGRMEEVSEEDDTVLLVYYSGHADKRSLHLNGSEFPLDELSDTLDDLPADVRVLVVDACQSGELTRRKGGAPAEPFTIRVEDRLESEGLAIITSSSAGEDAQESDRLRGGIFTHHLVTGLLGAADTSGDRRVTLNEAYRYAHAQTIHSTSSTAYVQHPSYSFDLSGQQDLVLTQLEAPGVSGLLELTDAGSYLVFATRRDELIAELTVEGDTRVALDPGRYLVRLREHDRIRELEVEVSQGAPVRVERANMETVSYGLTVRKGLSESKRFAVQMSVGGGVVGPTVEGASVGPSGHLGMRFDLPQLSLGTRVHYTWQGWNNRILSADQHRVGLDLYLAKLFDLGIVAPGIGLKGGLDLFVQSFDSRGIAQTRQAFGGRVGPHVGLEISLSPRFSLGLWGGADVAMFRAIDSDTGQSSLQTMANPHALLEVGAYVF